MSFGNLNRGQRIPDPEPRKAEDLIRSKKHKRQKAIRSSVRARTVKIILTLISIAIFSGIIYLSWQALSKVFEIYTS